MDIKDGLALDRASVRAFDGDGHLHVDEANISKAVINPYLGSEIPRYQQLGLDPGKIYKLLRDPKELEAAADTFNGKPLLFNHRETTARDHDFEGTVGAIHDVRYEHPYLKGKLDVWAHPAIEAIKSDEKKQLSSGYRYDPDMTPGTYEGERYDGVMRNIRGNHVALVQEGRAGPDVVIGNSAINIRGYDMNKALSRKAALAQGALVSFLAPKMAKDAKINLAPVLSKITAQNFKAESAKIAQDVLSLTRGKLAKDGDLDLADVAKVLEAVAEIVPTEEEKKPDDVTTMDDDRAEKVKAICGGKLSDEEIASLVALLGAPPATDADPEPVKPNEPQEPNKPVGDDDKVKDMVTKPAMDAAIKAAVKVAHDTAIKTQQAIFAAHREVTKAVGDLPNCAMDSVENVYASGLKALNVDIGGVDPVAYRPMFQEIAKRSVESSRKPNPAVIAQDAAANDAYLKQFPNANRLSH